MVPRCSPAVLSTTTSSLAESLTKSLAWCEARGEHGGARGRIEVRCQGWGRSTWFGLGLGLGFGWG